MMLADDIALCSDDKDKLEEDLENKGVIISGTKNIYVLMEKSSAMSKSI